LKTSVQSSFFSAGQCPSPPGILGDQLLPHNQILSDLKNSFKTDSAAKFVKKINKSAVKRPTTPKSRCYVVIYRQLQYMFQVVSDMNISQGSVTTRSICDGYFTIIWWKFFAKSVG